MKYKLTLLYCFAVLILSVLPSKSFPKTEITNIDKIVHFLMYFFMVGAMFLDNFLAKASPPTPSQKGGECSPPLGELEGASNKKVLYFFFFAVIFGAVIEIIQHFLPTRSAEWYDVLSNSLGAFLGVMVIYMLKNRIFEKKS